MVVMRNQTLFKTLVVALSVMVISLFMSPVIFFDLVWDDYLFLYETDKYLASDKWLNSAFSAFFVSDNYFRPLPLMSYKLDSFLFEGLSGFHVMQLVYYVAAFVILGFFVNYLLAKVYRYSDGRVVFFLSFSSSTLLALHSVNVESAAWVSCRFEVFLLAFSLLTFLASVSRFSLFTKCLLVFIFYSLACFSKEMAVVVPVLIFLLHWFFIYRVSTNGLIFSIKKTIVDNWPAYVSIVAAGIVYMLVRYASMGYILIDSGLFLQEYGSFTQRLLAVSTAYSYYFSLFFTPFYVVKPVYDIAFPIPVNIETIFLFFSVVSVFFISVVGVLKGKSVVAFFVIVFMVALLPVAHILPMLDSVNIVQTRFMLLPSLFLMLFSVVLVGKLIKNINITYSFKLFFVVVVSLYSVFIVFDSRKIMYMWSNNLSLWTWASGEVSNHPSVLVNYSAALQQFGKAQKAVDVMESAKISNVNLGVQGHASYAGALASVKRYDEAKDEYITAISYLLREIEIVNKVGKSGETLYYLEVLLSEYYINLANVLFLARMDTGMNGDYADIKDLLITAEGINPWGYKHNALLAFVYLYMGMGAEAEERAELFISSAPDNKNLALFLKDYNNKKVELGL